MSSSPCWLARTRLPRGPLSLRRERDADVVAGYLQDAAHFPGGHASEVCFPSSETDVAALLAEGHPVLVVGAQSSLTGGATPRGEVLMSTSRLSAIQGWTALSVRCGAGVVLRELDAQCEARAAYFPPVPTYDGATVGGVVSGAASVVALAAKELAETLGGVALSYAKTK